ncbi:uncharacterized protein LOC121859897 [Homarus americanus]|nr:uncharacterized protein LOC121859897 [Homarus americanus]
MVLRYPEFIKTIGQGIKKVTNAVHDFGFGVSESIVNKFQGLKSVPTALGAGVAAIIPLDDADKTTPKPGPGIFFPTPSLPTFPKPQLPVLPSLPTISKPNFGSLFNKPTGSLSLSGSGSLSVNSGDEAETHYGSNGPSQSTLFVNKFV